MNLHLKSPLAFFDLETTGTIPSKDRIVEVAVLKVHPNGEEEEFHEIINPEIPIPAETSAIHGIYDKDVADKPTFKQIAKNLAKFLEGADLAGYNILKFDVPMLVEEFLRVNVEFDISKKKLIDAQKIFFLMEKRTLSAAYKFYCDKNLDNAHSAMADTKATFEVLKNQLTRYEGAEVEDIKGAKIGQIENDMEKLHNLTLKNMVDLAGRMVRNPKGEEIFNFGKHKGKLVSDVLQREPGYYDWMMNGDFPLDTKRRLTEIKLKSLGDKFKLG
ncbi:MAG TPA: DNA polymerase III subunit epsilon [Cytophagales bacterium]|jgi:DNA polymerase-3 subunit epsilon|nr:DNA polymerase III subunit epsilon [Cytophagales bacterium]